MPDGNGVLVEAPCPDCGALVWSLPEYAGTLRCSTCGRAFFNAPIPTGTRRPMWVNRPADPNAVLYREPPARVGG